MISLQNVLVGIDRLVHGANRMRGWGDARWVDPLFMTPVGFDPTAQRYRYLVNPRFGEPRRSAFHPPFQVIVRGYLWSRHIDKDANYRLYFGTDSLGHGRRKTYAEHFADIRHIGDFGDIIGYVLAAKDTLLLSDAQADTLRKLHAFYKHALDSLAAGPAHDLATLQPPFHMNVLFAKRKEYLQAIKALRGPAGYQVRAILTPEQWDQLPDDLIRWLPSELGGSDF